MTHSPSAAYRPMENPVIEGLACAAVHPGATGILLLDAAPEALWELASIYRRLLSHHDKELIPLVELPANASEDELWGQLALFHLLGKTNLATPVTQPDALLAPPRDAPLKLVVVPDLARLGLPAMRAATLLVDAPVGHVERHGLSLQWPQSLRWLAFAQRGDMRFISPHLLDRFPIRLPAQGWRDPQRNELLAAFIRSADKPKRQRAPLIQIPGGWLQRVRRTRQRDLLTFETEALDVLIEIADLNRGAGVRRELALGRLALGCARLKQAATVTAAHVRRAAQVMSWQLLASPLSEQGSRATDKQPSVPVSGQSALHHDVAPGAGAVADDSARLVGQPPSPGAEPVYSGEAVRRYSAMLASAAAFPEDTVVREETATSLKLVAVAEERRQEERGHIIGSLPTRSLHDLALLPTLLAAVPYQRLRGWQPGRRLILFPADLRRHRRALIPRYQLVVVLDQSDSLGGRWVDAMQPHIEWAYQHRAPVTVIGVGSAPAEPRRAHLALLESRRAEAIQGMMRLPQGHATPLAHGLFLALQQIEHLQRDVRSATCQIRLVVATDGRGNVPLMVSLQPMEHPPPYQTASAHADVLALATTLRSRRLQAFVLDPQSKHLVDLPAEVAAALGANLLFVHLMGD